MTKKPSLFLAALVAAIVGIGAFLMPAQAAEKLGTTRGWCVKSSTGELRTLRLTTAGKCQGGYWGPIALSSGVKGPAGPAGPKGDKGDPGEGGTVVLCTAGYTSRDIVVANAASIDEDGAKLKKAQDELATAKTALDAAKIVAAAKGDAVIAAQAKVYAADTEAALSTAKTALDAAKAAKVAADDAVTDAQKAVDTKQAAVDALLAAVAKTFTIRTCVKG